MKTNLQPKPESLNDQAYNRLLMMISDGDIRPADFISHRRLAEKLGMSKLPVGMALERLEAEGLAKSVPRVGTRICGVDAAEIWGMVNWRIAMECQVARLACERMNPGKAARLMAAAALVDKLELQNKPRKIRHPADVDYHKLLAEAAECPRLEKELERMNIYRVKMAMCESVRIAAKNSTIPPPDHRRLTKAIIAGPPGRAEQSMRDHLERSRVLYGFLEWYRGQQKEPAH